MSGLSLAMIIGIPWGLAAYGWWRVAYWKRECRILVGQVATLSRGNHLDVRPAIDITAEGETPFGPIG